jgi:hypothetical protein
VFNQKKKLAKTAAVCLLPPGHQLQPEEMGGACTALQNVRNNTADSLKNAHAQTVERCFTPDRQLKITIKKYALTNACRSFILAPMRMLTGAGHMWPNSPTIRWF